MKVVVVLFALCSCVPTFAQITTLGLIREYSFNGNANDSSGFNQNGTVINAVLTSDRFNNPNSAYKFNGINSYIEIPYDGLELPEYTYSVWANTATLPAAGTGTIVLAIGTAFNDQVINTNNSVGVNTGWGGNGYNLTGPAQYIAYSGQSLITNEWVHITMVRTNNKLSCYINCELVKEDSTIQNNSPSYGTDQIARIGARQNGATVFNGKIDDLRIYNRPLSYDEIIELCKVPQKDSIVAPIDTTTQLVIPNTFSPDGNGINDYFSIKNLKYYPELSIEIYNRWGIKIYDSKPYKNNWDGANYPDGTYYYLINDGKGKNYKGFFTIIK